MNCPNPLPGLKIKLLGSMPRLGGGDRRNVPVGKAEKPVCQKAGTRARVGAGLSGGRPSRGGEDDCADTAEREVFRLLVEGYTLRETAQQLGLKYSTVNTHMTGIYRKLGVNSRAELIIRYRDYDKEDAT